MSTLVERLAAFRFHKNLSQRVTGIAGTLAGPLTGFSLLLVLWKVASLRLVDIPDPQATLAAAAHLLSDPFYDHGSGDVGIGVSIATSLGRLLTGLMFAAALGLPIGFLLGRIAVLHAIFSPVISLLRPVSPLAWLPLGLLLFKNPNNAAIWAIFICSTWPMIINTADGVKRVPQDYLNVARVLNLSEWRVFTRIILPSAAPQIITGIRLSTGTAWLVIIAAEMFIGGQGIGSWLRSELSNLNGQNILIAIMMVGAVGLLLDLPLLTLKKRMDHGKA